MRPKTIAIFGSSQTSRGSTEWGDAYEAGRRCASAGHRVVTGGYGGVMEAASDGARSAGGQAIGVIAPLLFRDRTGANSFVTEVIESPTLSSRLGSLVDLADGALVMPGSIGTATEFLLAWNLNHIGRRNDGSRLPTCAIGETWQRLAGILAGTGADPDDVHFSSTISEGLDWLLQQPEILA